jgi:hypothetical protein
LMEDTNTGLLQAFSQRSNPSARKVSLGRW